MVAGIVISADGSRVKGACVRTNQEGRFRLTLRPGKYVVRAKDEADGYPDPMFLLSSDPSAKFPEIDVRESDLSDVRVMLGSRGGILEGEIRDDNGGLPIPGAKVTIRDAHNPAAFVEIFSNADGHFQFTVPARPVSVSAMARGYKTSPAEDVMLSNGDHRVVHISLEK